MAAGNFITKRDGLWHFARRVPASVAHLDKRTIVKETTRIRVADDPRGIKAAKVAARINQNFEAYWRGLGEGQSLEAKRRYDEARRRARMFGFDYLEAADVATRPRSELRARIDAVRGSENEQTVAALLGGEAPPPITVDQLLPEYEALTIASRRDMSPDQLRKWRNPRLRAVGNLRTVIGNKALAMITRDDAIEFQDWWSRRLIDEDLDIGTANREIGIISRLTNALDKRHRLGLGRVFSELRIEGEQKKSRIPLTPAFVADVMLRPGALDIINEQARAVVQVIAETGARLSEVVNLKAERIRLDHEIPHIEIRADGRRLKTPQSERDIPLVGVALEALRRHPDGFPRYLDKAASFSAAVNKTLAAHGLLESDRTIYSLRHTFEDRLTAVEAPEKVIAVLMGHKHARPKYGAGPSLKQKLEWLQRIAFKADAGSE